MLEGQRGPGTAPQGWNHSARPAPLGWQASARGFLSKPHLVWVWTRAKPGRPPHPHPAPPPPVMGTLQLTGRASWGQAVGVAPYQPKQCTRAELGLVPGGSPGPSLGDRVAAPPGGHCSAQGPEAATDTELSDHRAQCGRRAALPLSPPAVQSLLRTTARHQQGRGGGAHTKLCRSRQDGDRNPAIPGAGPRTAFDSPVPPAQRTIKHLLHK